MSGTDCLSDTSVTVPQHLILLLNGTFGILILAPHASHAVNVHGKADEDKAKYDGEECLGVVVGKVLHSGSHLVQLTPLGESPTCINVLFVLILVLRIILVRHLFTHDEFLPISHNVYD